MAQRASSAPPSSSTDRLNHLLECELSAVATYQRAVRKLVSAPGAEALLAIEREHWEAVGWLRDRVEALGGVPVATSGVWGAWPEAVEETARVVGDVAEIDALRQEELHSLACFRECLAGGGLDAETRALVVETLTPRAEKHLEILARRLGR